MVPLHDIIQIIYANLDLLPEQLLSRTHSAPCSPGLFARAIRHSRATKSRLRIFPHSFQIFPHNFLIFPHYFGFLAPCLGLGYSDKTSPHLGYAEVLIFQKLCAACVRTEVGIAIRRALIIIISCLSSPSKCAVRHLATDSRISAQ